MKDAAIHGMQWTRSESAVRFPTHSGSPRAFALAMTRVGGDGVYVRLLTSVIARRTKRRRGNPSCLEGRGRVVCSLTGSQWIATGLRPRDDNMG